MDIFSIYFTYIKYIIISSYVIISIKKILKEIEAWRFIKNIQLI